MQIKPWRNQSKRGGTHRVGRLESLQVYIRALWLLDSNPSRTAVRPVEPCVPPPSLRTIAAQSAKQPHHLHPFISFISSFLTSLVMPLALLALQHTAPSRNWVQKSLIAFQRRIKVVCYMTAQSTACVYLPWIQTLKELAHAESSAIADRFGCMLHWLCLGLAVPLCCSSGVISSDSHLYQSPRTFNDVNSSPCSAATAWVFLLPWPKENNHNHIITRICFPLRDPFHSSL